MQRVAPPGGIEPRLSTNPFCAGVPTTNPNAPIVVDFGTSIVAEGKVRGYYISKQRVPEGWLLGPPGDADHRSRRPLRATVGDDTPAGRHAVLQGLWPGVDPGSLGRGPLRRPVQSSVGSTGPRQQRLLPRHGSSGVRGGRLSVEAGNRAGRIDPRRPLAYRAWTLSSCPATPNASPSETRNVRGIPLDEQHRARLVELAGRLHVKIPD